MTSENIAYCLLSFILGGCVGVAIMCVVQASKVHGGE